MVSCCQGGRVAETFEGKIHVTSQPLLQFLLFKRNPELQLLKDFYLLGRGEIFRSLIEKSKDLLKVPPDGNTGQSKTLFVS